MDRSLGTLWPGVHNAVWVVGAVGRDARRAGITWRAFVLLQPCNVCTAQKVDPVISVSAVGCAGVVIQVLSQDSATAVVTAGRCPRVSVYRAVPSSVQFHQASQSRLSTNYSTTHHSTAGLHSSSKML